MELKVNEVQIPESVTFNYEELKQELTEKVSMYETMVYSDEQIREAKADKAALNKLKKALNDERIRREREYMEPFNDFKSKINEIIGIIDKPVAVIDKQVKEYEEKRKQDKLDSITDYFNSTNHPEWLHFSQIMTDKWLNVSPSMSKIQKEIDEELKQIKTDLDTLSILPEFAFEATEVYKSTLDITKAINESHRLSEMAKKKAEQERLAEETKKQEEFIPPVADDTPFEKCMNPPVEEEPQRQWVAFKALLSVREAQDLKWFFDTKGIEFKAI